MQAVILAAGKSTRTYPLTLTKPKPLLKAANKTLLEHNLENLRDFVDDVLIVVGYKKNLIKKVIGKKYKNLKIRYVEQKQQLGTGHALSVTEPYIKGRFVLLMGDDIYSKNDIKNCIKHKYSILTARVNNQSNASEPHSKRTRSQLSNFGVVIEKNGILAGFIEKPKKFVSDLISAAFYSLDKKIFQYIKKIKKSERNEFELPDAIKLMSGKENLHCVKSREWIPIVYAWDLLKADKILRKGKNIIGKNSKIYGNVKNSTIGDDCTIMGSVKNSIIMDKTIIDKNSIVEDSVIGEKVHFNGKIIAKNNVYSVIKDKKLIVKRLGAIIADNVKARNVIIKPGCKIWPNRIVSNKTIKQDII